MVAKDVLAIRVVLEAPEVAAAIQDGLATAQVATVHTAAVAVAMSQASAVYMVDMVALLAWILDVANLQAIVRVSRFFRIVAAAVIMQTVAIIPKVVVQVMRAAVAAAAGMAVSEDVVARIAVAVVAAAEVAMERLN